MSDGGAIDGVCAGREKGVRRAAQGGSCGADIVDKQNALALHPPVSREAPPGELHSPDPAVPGLPMKTVAAKGGFQLQIDHRRHGGADEVSCTETST